jgi:acetyl esterase/lipase
MKVVERGDFTDSSNDTPASDSMRHKFFRILALAPGVIPGRHLKRTSSSMNRRVFFLITFAATAAAAFLSRVSLAAEASRAPKNIAYVEGGHEMQRLDLYLPRTPGPHPLIVWVHGGAWRAGSKQDMPLGGLIAEGFAVASLDYRLSTVAPMPAQMHDIKAAIRFLRAHSADYGFDPKRFAVAGSSAGGHLAALTGTSNGNKELEGKLGANLDQSSDVQAIVSFFGASDLQTILGQSTEHGLSVRVPALQLLLGGQPDEKPALAKLASPVAHANAHVPPLLLIHGDADPQMPFEQSRELEAAYRKAGRPVEFVVMPGSKHGGKEFFDAERLAIVEKFLRTHLK